MSNLNSTRRSLPSGVYAPLPTFFDSDEELDLVSFRRHLTRKLPVRRLYNNQAEH
jgi:hypothetical protein